MPSLFHHGILGLNARNLLYVKPFNPRRAVAFADDKLKTKLFLSARGIPSARIYARIEHRRELRNFSFDTLPDECVLKPNQGFGGEGIMVFQGRKNGALLEQGKRPISDQELRNHIEDILDGRYSLGGRRDSAFFEQLLHPHECFAPFRPAGLPDVRIIVFNLVPVMAMVRIPTAISHGKANVHLGGIGIGVDIAKGTTTHAVQYHHLIQELPHGLSPAGHPIPFWDELLLISSRIQYLTNIGYLAVDITIERDSGPMLLEVNARAGLMVQVANLAPLHSRLERVEGVKVGSPEKGVRIAQDLFGEKMEGRKGKEQEKTTVGTQEVVEVVGAGVSILAPCFISPEKERTVFAKDLLRELERKGGTELTEEKGERQFRVKFTLGGKKVQTVVTEGPMPSRTIQAVIGRRDLTGFLIDPQKEGGEVAPYSTTRKDLRSADRFLASLDQRILLLKALKPLNLQQERTRLLDDRQYNPTFLYPEISVDFQEAQQQLRNLPLDHSPLGILLEKKRRELLARLALLRARGDAIRFTECSAALLGTPSPALLAHASSFLHSRIACDLPPPMEQRLGASEAAALLDDALRQHGLHEWQVLVREGLVADCTVGRKRVYLRRGARFSQEHVGALIAHEIETHALAAENGAMQPVSLFSRGCANYLDTQEGLAIFNQNRLLSPHHEKRFRPAQLVLAISRALSYSFADTREYLEEEFGFLPERAITVTIGMKRGLTDTSEPGAFTKGLVYFRGLRAIEEFVQGGGDLRRLYVGKVALEDLELVEQIPGLKPPILLPSYLREDIPS